MTILMIFVRWSVRYTYVWLACLTLLWPFDLSLNVSSFINAMDDHIYLCPHQGWCRIKLLHYLSQTHKSRISNV